MIEEKDIFSYGFDKNLNRTQNEPIQSPVVYDIFNPTQAQDVKFGAIASGVANSIIIVDPTKGLWIGNTASANAPFFVNMNGDLRATSITINGQSLAGQFIFGDGNDGNVTISANTTLTSDKYYNNLTINSTFTLFTAGYKVFVKGTLTNNGTISRAGNAGGAGGVGTDGSNNTGGAGGAGGAAGAVLTDNWYSGGLAGQAGGTGGAGGNAGFSGSNGVNGTVGTAISSALGSNGVVGIAGGLGGNENGPNTGGTGGTAAAGGVATIAGTVLPRNLSELVFMRDFSAATILKFTANGGSGGSGGGGGGAGGGGSTNKGGGGGGGAGGSGSSGGIMVIFANTIANAGVITCTGGAGGAGGNGGSGAQGATQNNGGGGGGAGGSGGNGGLLILIYGTLTGAGTTTAAGGAGGTASTGGSGFGGGTNGAAGPVGTTGTAGTVVKLLT